MIHRLNKFIQNPVYLSVALVFSILSILMAFWVTRLPLIKHNLNLTDGDLGLALFFLPLGSVIAMLVSSKLVNTLGEGKTTIYSTVLLALSIIPPFFATNFIALCLTMLIIGVLIGILDIAVNAVAGILEQQKEVIIMSTCHGFFSLGGMIGALIASTLIGMSVAPIPQMIVSLIIVSMITFYYIYPKIIHIQSAETPTDEPSFALPTKNTIWLSIVGFCILMGEGAVMDWSTIYLEDFLSADPFIVGFGFAGFSLFMTLGRFNGDIIISRIGEIKTMTYGSVIALVGTALVVVGEIYLSIAGFSLIGLGYSTIVPILFSRAAKIEGMSPAHGVAAVAGSGYVGFLFGPVIIGLIADSFGLNTSFGLLLILTFISLYAIRKAF